MGCVKLWCLQALALLDTQSNTHFITDKPLQELGLTGEPTHLQLSTMHGTKLLSANVIENLHVQGIGSESGEVTLSRCFSRDAIPFDKMNVPTSGSI